MAAHCLGNGVGVKHEKPQLAFRRAVEGEMDYLDLFLN